MKTAFILRLYSGLKGSVVTEKWKPQGAPAIYKLIEEFSERNIPLDVYFLCKNEKDVLDIKKSKQIRFKGLNVNFYVVRYYSSKFVIRRFKHVFNDFFQFCVVGYKLCFREKYALVYLDRVNIVLAAILSCLGIKTVVRFMGIANFKFFATSLRYRLSLPLVYLSLKVPFRLAICTEDGSPAKNFFKKCLNNKTPTMMLINGIDTKKDQSMFDFSIRAKYKFLNNFPLFLFVGRVSDDKGCYEFVETLLKLKEFRKDFYSIIITGGEDHREFSDRISSNGLSNNVIFESFVDHDIIGSYFEQSDVYISINKLGSLSNVVLEAIAAGKCIVMLGKDDETKTDESTKMLIPENVVIRIDRKNIVNDLTEKLLNLLANPEKIIAYSECMMDFRKNFLRSWDERVNCEIDLLKKVVDGEPVEV